MKAAPLIIGGIILAAFALSSGDASASTPTDPKTQAQVARMRRVAARYIQRHGSATMTVEAVSPTAAVLQQSTPSGRSYVVLTRKGALVNAAGFASRRGALQAMRRDDAMFGGNWRGAKVAVYEPLGSELRLDTWGTAGSHARDNADYPEFLDALRVVGTSPVGTRRAIDGIVVVRMSQNTKEPASSLGALKVRPGAAFGVKEIRSIIDADERRWPGTKIVVRRHRKGGTLVEVNAQEGRRRGRAWGVYEPAAAIENGKAVVKPTLHHIYYNYGDALRQLELVTGRGT